MFLGAPCLILELLNDRRMDIWTTLICLNARSQFCSDPAELKHFFYLLFFQDKSFCIPQKITREGLFRINNAIEEDDSVSILQENSVVSPCRDNNEIAEYNCGLQSIQK